MYPGVPPTLTISRIENNIAVILTDDLQMFELPASTIGGFDVGSLATINFSRADDILSRRAARFQLLQKNINNHYSTHQWHREIIKYPVIKKKTPASIAISCTETTEFQPFFSSLKSITGYCNGIPFGTYFPQKNNRILTATGLNEDTEYKLTLIFRTTAGLLATEDVVVKTPASLDFSWIVAFADESVGESARAMLGKCAMIRSDMIPEEVTHYVSNHPVSKLKEDNPTMYEACVRSFVEMVSEDWINDHFPPNF